MSSIKRIPAELKQLDRWCVFGTRTTTSDKIGKVPLIGGDTARKASITNRDSWRDISTCAGDVDAFDESMLGVGFAFDTDLPYVLVDVDDYETKAPDDLRQKVDPILERLRNYSYAEESYSGNGRYHIIIKLDDPDTYAAGMDRHGIGVYRKSRWCLTTGKVLEGSPAKITGGHDELITELVQLLSNRTASKALQSFEENCDATELTDAEVIAWCIECSPEFAQQVLLGHRTEDASTEDLGFLTTLCRATPDNTQVLRIFESSAMFRPDKMRKSPGYLKGLSIPKARAAANNYGPMIPQRLYNENPFYLEDYIESDEENEIILTPMGMGESQDKLVTINRIDYFDPPPGLAGELLEVCTGMLTKKHTAFAYAAIITFLATISGRSHVVRDIGYPSGLNMYVMLLADTGSGKGGALQLIDWLFKQIPEQEELMKGDKHAFLRTGPQVSPEGLHDLFEETCTVLSVVREGAAHITNNVRDTFAMKRRATELDLYTSAGPYGSLEGLAGALKRRDRKIRPAFNMFLETQPHRVTQIIADDGAEDGYFSRLLTFLGQDEQKRLLSSTPVVHQEMSKRLKDNLAQMANIAYAAVHPDTANLYPLYVDWQAGALDIQANFHKNLDELVHKMVNEGRYFAAQVSNRAMVNSMRIAALLAVLENPRKPVIKCEQIRWAKKFVKRTLKDLFKLGRMSSAVKLSSDNRYFVVMGKIYRYCKTDGIVFTRRDIAAAVRGNPAFAAKYKDSSLMLDEVLNELCKNGHIERVPTRKGQAFKLISRSKLSKEYSSIWSLYGK